MPDKTASPPRFIEFTRQDFEAAVIAWLDSPQGQHLRATSSYDGIQDTFLEDEHHQELWDAMKWPSKTFRVILRVDYRWP